METRRVQLAAPPTTFRIFQLQGVGVVTRPSRFDPRGLRGHLFRPSQTLGIDTHLVVIKDTLLNLVQYITRRFLKCLEQSKLNPGYKSIQSHVPDQRSRRF
jgi:hypothetical protein